MIQKAAEYKKVCKTRSWTLAVVGRETRLVKGHSISDSSVRYFYCVYVHSFKKPIIIVVVVIVFIII